MVEEQESKENEEDQRINIRQELKVVKLTKEEVENEKQSKSIEK